MLLSHLERQLQFTVQHARPCPDHVFRGSIRIRAKIFHVLKVYQRYIYLSFLKIPPCYFKASQQIPLIYSLLKVNHLSLIEIGPV